eukprot:3749508-Rhodomonas_salina.1
MQHRAHSPQILRRLVAPYAPLSTTLPMAHPPPVPTAPLCTTLVLYPLSVLLRAGMAIRVGGSRPAKS